LITCYAYHDNKLKDFNNVNIKYKVKHKKQCLHKMTVVYHSRMGC